jgi:hypothetical protein
VSVEAVRRLGDRVRDPLYLAALLIAMRGRKRIDHARIERVHALLLEPIEAWSKSKGKRKAKKARPKKKKARRS